MYQSKKLVKFKKNDGKMLLIKADFLVTSTKTAKLDFSLFRICLLEPSLPDPDTAPLKQKSLQMKDLKREVNIMKIIWLMHPVKRHFKQIKSTARENLLITKSSEKTSRCLLVLDYISRLPSVGKIITKQFGCTSHFPGFAQDLFENGQETSKQPSISVQRKSTTTSQLKVVVFHAKEIV